MIPTLSLAFFLLFGATLADESNQSIIGTWEFVSARRIQPDGNLVQYTALDLRSTKILNATHFSVTTRNADGSFRHTNLGPYKLEGDLYTETLEYSTYPDRIGRTPTYKSSVEGDLWKIEIISRTGAGGNEVWRRVKGPREAVEF